MTACYLEKVAQAVDFSGKVTARFSSIQVCKA